MNGAQSLIRTFANSGIEVCFTNPGTSEMHFVAALDHVPEMRGVLALFEGVVSGAADGYARIADKPAATLLHLGPGLGNSLANLHNARRAQTPIVNVVGDHATYHRHLDAPLASDIESVARNVSKWVRTSASADAVGRDGAEAVAAAMSGQRGVSTLILPADTAWNDAPSGPSQAIPIPARKSVSSDVVRDAARAIEKSKRTIMIIAGEGLRARGLEAAGRIAAKTGAELWYDMFNGRMERGAGRVPIKRIPYFAEQAVEALDGAEEIILIGSKRPASFFAYPGKASDLVPEGVEPIMLAQTHEDIVGALEALADEVAAPAIDKFETDPRCSLTRSELPSGALTSGTIGHTISTLLPENAIMSDESATSGLATYALTQTCPAHDWLFLSGGSIGQGLPVAAGAAIAAPDRKVVCLHGDGGAMYTPQALWTMAREKLDVTTVIAANRSYAILNIELMRVGAENPGPKALSLLDLTNPTLDWVSLAQGMGVEAMRSETSEQFNDHFKYCMENKGPHLIEAVI